MRFCFLAILLSGCASNSTSPEQAWDFPRLTLVASRTLPLNEPSGLTLGASGETLWVVGNAPERIYKLTANGLLLDTLAYVGQDLEGIAFNPADSTLWIVEEERREVVKVDTSGRILSRHPVALTGVFNRGLEGVGRHLTGALHLLNEKDPGLFISLAIDMSIDVLYELDFASDYTGLAYDGGRDAFWGDQPRGPVDFSLESSGRRGGRYGDGLPEAGGRGVRPNVATTPRGQRNRQHPVHIRR